MKYTASRNAPQNKTSDTLEVISIGPEVAERPGSEILSAKTFEGAAVVNLQEEDVGKVSHIMIDMQGGQIAYAVVSIGGLLGVGSKLYAIPWAALTFDAQNNRFSLDLDKERLENAPGFDKDHWPSMTDIAWGTGIHDYYGQRNYWLRPSGNQVKTV